MLTSLLRREPPPAPEPPSEPAGLEAEFVAARDRYAALRAADQERRERVSAMELARAIENPECRGESPRHLAERALPYRKLARRRPAKLEQEIADLRDQIEDGKAALFEAHEQLEAAKRRRTDEIAQELQPRHAAAVRAIAAALEDLSRSIAAEEAVHDELRARAPSPVSRYLPRLGAPLADAAIFNHGSTAARWAQECRKLGVLQ